MARSGGALEPTLRPEHLYNTVLLAFGLAVAFRFFDTLAQVLLLAYVAAILAIALEPVAKRLRLQRRWVALGVGTTALGSFALAIWLGVPALARQTRSLAERGPDLQQRLGRWNEWLHDRTGLDLQIAPDPHSEWAQRVLHSLSGGQVLARMQGIVESLVIAVTVFFGALFAFSNPNERILTPLLRAVPADRRPGVHRVLELLANRLLGWVRGTAVAVIVMAVFGSIALSLIGVSSAVLLGIWMGMGEFVPILGPWITSIPRVLIAFMDSPAKGLWIIIAVLALQQFESNVLVPWAMSRQAEVHPMVSLFAIILFGRLFGFLGLLLAIPIVLLIWTLVQVLWVERTIHTGADRIAPVVEE